MDELIKKIEGKFKDARTNVGNVPLLALILDELEADVINSIEEWWG